MTTKKGWGMDILRMLSSKIYRISENKEIIKLSFKTPIVPRRAPPIDDIPERSNETMGLFNADATLAETVLVNEGGVKITATGLTYTTYSVELGLAIENNSGKDLSLISGSLGYSCNSVNGYMVDEGYPLSAQ